MSGDTSRTGRDTTDADARQGQRTFNEGRTTGRQWAELLATNGQFRGRLQAGSHGRRQSDEPLDPIPRRNALRRPARCDALKPSIKARSSATFVSSGWVEARWPSGRRSATCRETHNSGRPTFGFLTHWQRGRMFGSSRRHPLVTVHARSASPCRHLGRPRIPASVHPREQPGADGSLRHRGVDKPLTRPKQRGPLR